MITAYWVDFFGTKISINKKIRICNFTQELHTRTHLLYEKSKRLAFSVQMKNFRCNESSFVGHIMQTIKNICLRKNKSKQSYAWIDSIFEAQNICFGTEIAGLLDFSYKKYALVEVIFHKVLILISYTL